MLYANGDQFITYSTDTLIEEKTQEDIKGQFETFQSDFLVDINVSNHDITFTYIPIDIMLEYDTIEPSLIVLEAARVFLNEVGVSI